MKKLIFLIPVILIVLFIVIVVVLSNRTSTKVNITTIKIVAAENFYGDIAQQIGGNKVTITNILSNPRQDPHEYEPTSQDAVSVSEADIIIKNGLGYDSFMDQILESLSNKTVISVGELAGFTDQDNPHVWYNIDVIKNFALNLKQELIKKDSSNQAFYESNYSSFLDSLAQIDLKCSDIKNNYSGTQVIAIERIADYILKSCGLTPIPNNFQKAVEEGTDPSVDTINSFENAIKNKQAKVLIYNIQTESQLTEKEKAVATDNHVPVLSFSETMPIETTYVTWIVNQLTELETALNNK